MKLRQRFRRLTFWNKLGVGGSLASLLALVIVFGQYAIRISQRTEAYSRGEMDLRFEALAAEFHARSEEDRKAQEKLVTELILAIQQQRSELEFDGESIAKLDRVARDLQESVQTRASLPENESRVVGDELQVEINRLHSDLRTVERYLDGNAEALEELLEFLKSDEFRVGTIKTPAGVRVYGSTDGERFLRDVTNAAADGALERITRGTLDSDGNCVGAPRNCGEIVLAPQEGSGSEGPRINWYLGPANAEIEQRLTRQDPNDLRLLLMANLTACEWYKRLAHKT